MNSSKNNDETQQYDVSQRHDVPQQNEVSQQQYVGVLTSPELLPVTPELPTGDQFELRRGKARARIGALAAVLREFSVDGTHYTETWPDDTSIPQGAGMVLMPWPNRVAHGSWTWEGKSQQLDITEPARGNAIHGLLRNTPYTAVSATADSVTLAAPIYPQHGWPFTLRTTVTYELTAAGLRVTHQVRNAGTKTAVFGCGAHPYLRIGAVPFDELTLTVSATHYLATDDSMIPTSTQLLPDELAALPTGAQLSDLHLDTGFTGLEVQGGRIEHVLSAPDGRTLTLWTDPVFAWAQVFTPRAFPDYPSPSNQSPDNPSSSNQSPDNPRRSANGQRSALAIEPMTAPADALNSGQGLIQLAPGEVWSGSWGLTPA